jgi:hypothetical protein
MMELSKLAEKDPEFYKYLQENDKELLDFDPNDIQEDPEDLEDVDGDVEMDNQHLPTLTTNILKRWQRALLEVRVCLPSISPIFTFYIVATVSTCATKIIDSFQSCGPHERRRPSTCLEH